MKRIILLLSITLGLSFSLFAGNISKDSVLKWKASKGAAGFKLGSHYGKVPLLDGTIEEKKGKLTGGNFTADMKNFTVDDLTGGTAKKFLGHMASADFFKVSDHPTAKLVISKVTGKKVDAKLTINGITNDVSFDYKKDGKYYLGKLTFNRLKYNINYNSKESLGDKFIHKDVELEFKIAKK